MGPHVGPKNIVIRDNTNIMYRATFSVPDNAVFATLRAEGYDTHLVLIDI